MNAEDWLAKGEYVEINGFQHFVYQSNNDKPFLLILHGYPTCSYDFYKVLPWLEKHYSVVIHDHLGFGYSDKPKNITYSLMNQTDQALQLWKKLGITTATVLAHDYGTSVATELIARHNEGALSIKLNQCILCNGSMHVEMAQLRPIQKLLLNRVTGPWVARLSSRGILARNLKKIYWDPTLVESEEVDVLFYLMTFNQGRQVLHKTTQYIKQRYTYWTRWIGGLQETELPIHIVWAKNDPVAIHEMAIVLHKEIKNSTLISLENSGHYPMLESPERWSKAVLDGVFLKPK